MTTLSDFSCYSSCVRTDPLNKNMRGILRSFQTSTSGTIGGSGNDGMLALASYLPQIQVDHTYDPRVKFCQHGTLLVLFSPTYTQTLTFRSHIVYVRCHKDELA
jgi:hypothetical protein